MIRFIFIFQFQLGCCEKQGWRWGEQSANHRDQLGGYSSYPGERWLWPRLGGMSGDGKGELI